MSNELKKLYNILSNFNVYHSETVPLCAAENVISEFCKLPLTGDLQSRYIMGNHDSFDIDENFIGSQQLVPIYSGINDLCRELFKAEYSDARTLTGMNCMTTLLMSLTNMGEKIAILPSDWGGHPSVKAVCERLGLLVYCLPYNRENFDLDYEKCNFMLDKEQIKYIILAPSDIIEPLSVEKLNLCGRELFYDISQIMGLVAGNIIDCPLSIGDNVIIFGGTHKTFPGPSSGLIMTNSKNIYNRLLDNINPKYLRHTQMHQVASLLFALLEFKQFGKDYANAIVKTSNQLGKILEQRGFNIAKIKNVYSKTHQLFLLCSEEETEQIYKNAVRFGITLNKKNKLLFSHYGIRLGTQEISRYGWDVETLKIIGEILCELRKSSPNIDLIFKHKSNLPSKKLLFTYKVEDYSLFGDILH
jgi:glycine/serine hydroxymethyltransferase